VRKRTTDATINHNKSREGYRARERERAIMMMQQYTIII
jgi:hypothetical protein